MRRATLAAAALALLAGCKATLPEAPAAAAAPAGDAASVPAAAPTDEAATRAADLRHLQSLDLGLASIPAAQAYLDALLQRIQAAGPQPAKAAQVVIRPKLSYNAATTASGLIVVDLGWLKSIESDAELSALLAHEYGHLVRDHLGAKNQVGTATHYATLAAAVFAAKAKVNNSWSVSIVNSGWSSLLMPGWSRDQEYEADAFAVDATQALGLPFVPSVRAFLDRIQSVEKSAQPANAAPKPKANDGSTLPAASDDHPPIEERIARVQKQVEGRPRVRPRPQARDEWRAVRDSAEFQAAEAEYVLAARFFEAVKAGRNAELPALARQLDARPRPLRTAAAMTVQAWMAPDAPRKAALLEQAIAAPDASFMAYGLLAVTQRDPLQQWEASVATLQAGLERFDSPHQHWPDVIDFQRSLNERINAIPQQQRSLAQSMFSLKLASNIVVLKARCVLNPEVAEACDWASLSAQQKQARLQAQKDKDAAVANKVDQKIKGLFNKK